MNYYPFNVGDYAAHTSHLEPMEDLAYRRLLDQYYLREGALPADIQATAKLVRMRSMVADVEAVLNEFFTLTESGWVHDRCEHEIERMQDKQAKARASAKASVNARLAKSLNVRSTDVQLANTHKSSKTDQSENVVENLTERSTDVNSESNERSTDVQEKRANVELPTPTPTPIKKNTSAVAPPDGVSSSVWTDFQKLRKTKKAPLTETSLAAIKREAEKAGWSVDAALQECCARGWQSFKADWVVAKQSAPESMFAGAI